MSSSHKSGRSSSFDAEELLQFGTRCRELRKEKDLLKESQSQSFDLIRQFEQHVKSLSEAHAEDKKQIQMLQKELMNCSQEIDYLQDQLSTRNTDVNFLEERVHSLELKLADMEDLQEKFERLEEELKRSNSECYFLMQELESKEVELENSTLCVEKLQESISSITLDSQCEIESMKLDIVALEQSYLEAEKIQEENAQEKVRINRLIQELEVQFQNAQKTIKFLELENKELKEKLDTSDTNFRIFFQRLKKWLAKDGSQLNTKPILIETESKLTMSKEMSIYEDVLNPLISKLALVLGPDGDAVEKMSQQIEEYEILVKQLKDELREEKLKAKEEAEDLAQEMAELRYQMTGLLEEERERRACIEQASLQRISELESRVRNEQNTSLAVVKHHHGA
ncbi:hypothetical protein UlMin_008359 [Ulmus minor]